MPEPTAGRSRQFGLRPRCSVGRSDFKAEFGVHDPVRPGFQRRTVRAGRAPDVLDSMLALGLLLSPSSQLRFNRLPVGPGEICLLVWLVLILGQTAIQRGPIVTPALSRMLVFWALFAIALSIGTMTAFALNDRHDPVWFLHDAIAYPFLAAVSCLSVVGPNAEQRFRRVAWLLIVMGTGSLALQLADAWGYVGIPHTDPWYWNRFRGWSENPEQLALLCAALAFVSLHVIETATKLRRKLVAVACAILAIYVGRLTWTDTFTIVLLAAGPIFVLLKLKAWLHSSERKMPLRSAVAWIAILALPLILASVVPLVSSSAGRTTAVTDAMLKDNGRDAAQETELRLHLWKEAWRRGVESGMLGLGPGPHLNTPSSIVAARAVEVEAPKDVLHPAVNGTPNFEAHNTTLDLFTQGGLLAVLAFLWLAGTALVNAYRTQFAGLAILIGGLFLFGMAGSIVRQPIFWFAIAFGLAASARTRPIRRRVTIPLSADRLQPSNASIYPLAAREANHWSGNADTKSSREPA